MRLHCLLMLPEKTAEFSVLVSSALRSLLKIFEAKRHANNVSSQRHLLAVVGSGKKQITTVCPKCRANSLIQGIVEIVLDIVFNLPSLSAMGVSWSDAGIVEEQL